MTWARVGAVVSTGGGQGAGSAAEQEPSHCQVPEVVLHAFDFWQGSPNGAGSVGGKVSEHFVPVVPSHIKVPEVVMPQAFAGDSHASPNPAGLAGAETEHVPSH